MSAHQHTDMEADHTAPGECRITVLAVCRLRRSGYGALHGVDCTFESGVLHLRGRVPTYYLKQIAQSLVVDLEGVLHLKNQLEVFAEARDAVPAMESTERGAAPGALSPPERRVSRSATGAAMKSERIRDNGIKNQDQGSGSDLPVRPPRPTRPGSRGNRTG